MIYTITTKTKGFESFIATMKLLYLLHVTTNAVKVSVVVFTISYKAEWISRPLI